MKRECTGSSIGRFRDSWRVRKDERLHSVLLPALCRASGNCKTKPISNSFSTILTVGALLGAPWHLWSVLPASELRQCQRGLRAGKGSEPRQVVPCWTAMVAHAQVRFSEAGSFQPPRAPSYQSVQDREARYCMLADIALHQKKHCV
jgi:hypothetical protein